MMEKITIEIDTRSNKGKHLLGLIKEMAKEGSFVKIQGADTIEEVKEALKEVKAGKRKPISQLFK